MTRLLTALLAPLQVVAFASTALSAQGRGSAMPPMPFEDVGACPYEGCVYRMWTANAPVTAYRERRVGSAVAFKAERGDQVRALTGIVITTVPGRVEFLKPFDMWSTQGMVHAKPGDILYTLTYHGEGSTTAWFKGRLYDQVDGHDFLMEGCDRTPEGCPARVLAQPQRVWWIRVMSTRSVVGWTLESTKFDGRDAYGGP